MNNWIKTHDNRLSFTILYVGLSVALSVFVSIFWLIPVVLLHAYFEWQAIGNEEENKFRHVFLHLKLDITLVIFALWLGVYFESIFGLLGLSAASRAAAQGGSRFLAWQKSIKGVLMTMDDAAQIIKGATKVKAKGSENNEDEKEELTVSGIVIIGFGAAMLLSIVFAPYIIDVTYTEVADILKTELNPWP